MRDRRVLALYLRQLAVCIHSGVPIVHALGVLQKGESALLNACFRDVRTRIEAGQYLSKALRAHPDVFAGDLVGVVRVGEETGSLHHVLLRASDVLEKSDRIERQIRSGLSYPLTLMVVSFALLALLTIHVVPAMAPLFDLAGSELPWVTNLLLSVSLQARNPGSWGWLALLALVVYLAGRQVVQAEVGSPLRQARDRALLNLPLLGSLIRKAILARIFRMLALMLDSGLPLLTALEILKETTEMEAFQEAIELIRKHLQGGDSFSQALAGVPLFPTIARALIAVGEESGSLERRLTDLSRMLDEEIAYQAEETLALLEPLLLCACSLIVMGVCIATLLPWIKLLSTLGR